MGFGPLTWLTPTNPAAGAEAVFTLPSGVDVVVYALTLKFTASVAVATRQPVIVAKIGSLYVWQSDPGNNIVAAGSLLFYGSWNGVSELAVTAGDIDLKNLPPLPVGTKTIETLTNGLQAADQYSLLGLLYRPIYTL